MTGSIDRNISNSTKNINPPTKTIGEKQTTGKRSNHNLSNYKT